MTSVTYCNLSAHKGRRMMYISSTDLEQGNWTNLLLSFPHEALYYMTLGKSIIIEDKSSNRTGKVERIFCPAMTDFLRGIVFLPKINKRVEYHTNLALDVYRENIYVRRKYNFFRHKLKTFQVIGRTIRVKKEISVFNQYEV